MAKKIARNKTNVAKRNYYRHCFKFATPHKENSIYNTQEVEIKGSALRQTLILESKLF